MNFQIKNEQVENTEVRKVSLISVLVNLILSFLKFIFGIISGSQALIADALHSLSDLITDFVLFFGVKYWTKPADETHPYGHRKIESIITIFIGLLLAFVGIMIAYNSVIHFFNKNKLQYGIFSLMVALLSILSKEILFRWTLSKALSFNSKALEANAWHHRSDGLSSIPVALSILMPMINEKLYFFDMIGAFIVTFMLLQSAWNIVKTALYEITDVAVERNILKQIELEIQNISEIKDFHALRTRHISSYIYMDVHILVDSNISVKEGHHIAGYLKYSIMHNIPKVKEVLIHIEPYEKNEKNNS